MVVTTFTNLTFPVESLQLLPVTSNIEDITLPNILDDTRLGTEITFYKLNPVSQILKRAGTNIFLNINQQSSTTYIMTIYQTNAKFVAIKSGSVYGWAIVSESTEKSGSVRFTPTSYEQVTTVFFSSPFLSAPSSIVLSPSFEGTYNKLVYFSVDAITATGFHIITQHSDISYATTIYWIAL